MAVFVSGRYEGALAGNRRMRLRCECDAGDAPLRLSADIVEPDGSIYSFVCPEGPADRRLDDADGVVRRIVRTAGAATRNQRIAIAPGDGAARVLVEQDEATFEGVLPFVDRRFRDLAIGIDWWPGVAAPEGIADGSPVGERVKAAFDAAGIVARLVPSVPPTPAPSSSPVTLAGLHVWLSKHPRQAVLRDGEHYVSLLFCGSYANRGGGQTRGVMYEKDDDFARQGVAIFLDAFAGLDLETWRTEVAFAILHEIGHALNLPHAWLRRPPGRRALSWMTYPHYFETGVESFWTDFGTGRFDETETPYLRHAAYLDIAPGASRFDRRSWKGFASDGDSDFAAAVSTGRVSLRIEPLKPLYALGEPVFLKAVLRNDGPKSLLLPRALDPSESLLSIAVTPPSGDRRIFQAPALVCQKPRMRRIAPGKPLDFDGIHLTFSRDGPMFEEPGVYRIEANYAGGPFASATATAELRVLYPTRTEELFARALFADGKLCRAIWLRHPLVARDAWRRFMDEHLERVSADAGNTTGSYLHFVAALGWLSPVYAGPDAPSAPANLAKARDHLRSVNPAFLPKGVALRRQRHAAGRAAPSSR